MKYLRKTILFLSIAGYCTLIISGCDESLPPYEDPRDVLKASLNGRYVLSATENSIKIDVYVVNTFDETFQAKGILDGVGTIMSKRDNSFIRTFTLTPSHWTWGKYDTRTGVLTMDPGDTLRLTYSWNYLDDKGRDARESIFSYFTDRTCTFRRISIEETFILQVKIKVYEKVPEIVSKSFEYSLCHVSSWVDPKVCTRIRTDLPCSQW